MGDRLRREAGGLTVTQSFESATNPVSDSRLLLRGIALLLGTVLLAAAAIAKSEGAFSNRVEVVALLANVGDGLPRGSDVKFRGALVGTVEGVTPSIDGGDNEVDLTLDPHFAHAIPASVTARVVPGNVFAVSSVQLVDNGSGPALKPGSQIRQDDSLATVQFQTALSKLRDVLAAAGRPGSTDTVGVLAAVAEATSGRGDELERAGSGANRIVDQLNRIIADDGTEATLAVLSEALQGLEDSAPDLLDAVHSAVVPMRTFAEKRQELTTFLSAGHATFGEVGTSFENNTDQMIVITTQMSPVMGVMADGSGAFAPIVTRINDLTNRFFEHVWHEDKKMAVGKFMLVLTPNRMYTRQDCPRYGALEGPSCRTAPLTADPPVLPRQLDPRNYQPPGGNVGPVGSPQERAELSELLGPQPNAAAELLLGPVLRGSTVHIVPDPSAAAPPGSPLPAEAAHPGSVEPGGRDGP
ncbi:mammalian cell entry protein [Mycobacterium holsaticum DSM 44478]|nr:mammalian cell entry protein [Mycolicibacterium holsaticum DSM 44478 = JCM 12374]